ncbi:cytochrome P450 [Actinoplanes sp. NPDC049548]|uniref:cytochrome P450 n=1 Tax=Actinoplanes sp. NPDC049548 TaxID=3155152 RepID=UPI00344114CD
MVPVVTPAGDPMKLVRDYALGRSVLTDARFSRAAAVQPHAPKLVGAEPVSASMMSIDGAEHARLRRIVAGTFTSGRIAAMAPEIEKLVDGHLDDIEAAGPGADVMTLLAEPLPLTVMCALMGVPREDSERFQSWVTVLFDISASTPQDKVRHRVRLARYMTELVGRKRREPGRDLLTALIQRHDGGELSMTELVTMGLALLMAGYETTIGQIGLSVLSLLSDPALREAFLQRPEPALEELLRLNPSTPASFPRVATETVRLGEATIEAGEAVLVSLIDANRDERVFGQPAAPQRRRAAHLTFGHGPHRCPGAPLARLQVRTAAERLLRRFPAVRLAESEPVVWREGLLTRGLTRLSVQW